MFVEHKEVGEQQPVRELDEVSNLLLKAANLIEKHGLAKGLQFGPGGSMCVYGAILLATTGKREQGAIFCSAGREAVDRLEAHVGKAEGHEGHEGHGWGAARWNNDPARTQAEVVAKIRAVALGG